MSETALLQVEKLSKSFGKFQAIADVSLSVKTGTLSALIGPNGAGKTTFYNVVTGRYRPSHGHIFFEGTDVTRAPTHKLVARGLLRSFQITNIFPALSVMENVIAPLVIQHHSSFSFLESLGKREDFVEEGRNLLERVGLADKAARIASTLAYGDKRLVEIAIVLARRPKLVLLDEPTAGMTPQETDRMIHLIKDLAEQSVGRSITEHDMKVVFAVAERIFVLHQGRLLAEGLPEEIRSNRTVKEAYEEGVSMLQITDLHVYYGDSHVLQGMSLEVHSGEIVCLLGRNGAGKTTTIRGISGLNAPARGKVLFNGVDITGRPVYENVRKGLAYVPEDRRIFAGLTVDGNLEVAMLPPRQGRTAWSKDRVTRCLAARTSEAAKRRESIRGRAANAGDCTGTHEQSSYAATG